MSFVVLNLLNGFVKSLRNCIQSASVAVMSGSITSLGSKSGGTNSDCKSSMVVCCRQSLERVLVAIRKSSLLAKLFSKGTLKQPSSDNLTGDSSAAVSGVWGVQGFESKSEAAVLGSSSDYKKNNISSWQTFNG